jgi:hypothetical protein
MPWIDVVRQDLTLEEALRFTETGPHLLERVKLDRFQAELAVNAIKLLKDTGRALKTDVVGRLADGIPTRAFEQLTGVPIGTFSQRRSQSNHHHHSYHQGR